MSTSMSAGKSSPNIVFASVIAFLISAGWAANHFASVLVVLREDWEMSTRSTTSTEAKWFAAHPALIKKATTLANTMFGEDVFLPMLVAIRQLLLTHG